MREFRREQASPCCIAIHCSGLVRHSQGVLCAEGHLTCRECMDDYVGNCAGDDLRSLRRRRGGVLCPRSGALGCKAGAFSDSELGGAVSAAVFSGYVKARMKLLEVEVREEMELEVEQKIEAELKRLVALEEVQRKVVEG